MSIIIKGMDMPENCQECECLNVEHFFCQVSGRAPKDENMVKRRPEWCQLVEVPTQHGDLIDKETVRKNLVEELQRNKDPFPYQSYYPSWNDAVMAMLSAPTIIPADDKDINVPIKEDGE